MATHCPTCNGIYGRLPNGSGSSSADDLHSVSNLHSYIIKSVLESGSHSRLYTANELHVMASNYRFTIENKLFTYGSFHARHSELMRKGIFTMIVKDKKIIDNENQVRSITKPLYYFNLVLALQAIERGRFD